MKLPGLLWLKITAHRPIAALLLHLLCTICRPQEDPALGIVGNSTHSEIISGHHAQVPGVVLASGDTLQAVQVRGLGVVNHEDPWKYTIAYQPLANSQQAATDLTVSDYYLPSCPLNGTWVTVSLRNLC